MARVSVNPNARVGDDTEHAARAEFVTQEQAEQHEFNRDLAQQFAEIEREAGASERAVDARREVPRTRLDAANDRMKRPLPARSAERKMLSSRRKKDYNTHKTQWREGLPGTRTRAMDKVRKPDDLERINNALRDQQGFRSRLSPSVRAAVSQTDLAIQDYERTNEREHVVYAQLLSPVDDDATRTTLRGGLRSMIKNEESMTFDGYIPSSHSMGNIPDGKEIVMEIQTRSGAYLGTSDSTPNADHIVGRGRRLQPVDMYQADYVKPDGSKGRRWVVQMRDVSDE